MSATFDRTINILHYLLTKQRIAVGDGLIDLWRVLWYIDVSAAMEFGAPLTFFSYVKGDDGPKPTHFAWVMGRLQSCGALGGGGADYLAYRTAYLNPIRLADLSSFSAAEIEVMDRGFAAVSAGGYGGGRHSADSVPECILSMAKTGDALLLPRSLEPSASPMQASQRQDA